MKTATELQIRLMCPGINLLKEIIRILLESVFGVLLKLDSVSANTDRVGEIVDR